MPFDLALYDLVSPYLLRGDTFGQWHAALAVIYVSEHSVTVDDGGIVIRGVARFSGSVRPSFDPRTMTFSIVATNAQGHPANDPGRRDPWIDVFEANLEFELSAPRAASQKVANAVTAIGNAGAFANAAAVLNTYDSNTADPPPSDYANTQFTLDLLLTGILRPPFLIGAKLDPSGILVEDPGNAQVKFTLPRIKVRLMQGSAPNDPLQAVVLSVGAANLDDRTGVAQLLSMDPPYAFIGPSKVVGIGFRSATLDLAQGSTPPDVLAQFGYDDSWTGVYFPELRLYVAPNGAENLAVNASATNLLIGIGATPGITGDFELAVIDQGTSTLKLSARFYENNGRSYAITKASDGRTATATIPARTRMVVDIDGGLTPYTASAKIGGAAEVPGRLFDVDFGSDTSLTIVITAKGSQPGAVPTTLTITASRQPVPALPPAGTSKAPEIPPAKVETTAVKRDGQTISQPQLKLVSETSSQVTIALDTDAAAAARTHWTIDGVDRGTGATLTVDCGPGAKVNVQAEIPPPANNVGSFQAFYRFNHPKPPSMAPPPAPDDPVAYVRNPENTRDIPAPDESTTSPWAGNKVLPVVSALLDKLPGNTNIKIEIKGYASHEKHLSTDPNSHDFKYNEQLALNRANGLKAIIEEYAKQKSKTVDFSPDPKADMSNWAAQGTPRNIWWTAIASFSAVPPPGTTTTGTVSRPSSGPIIPIPIPDNPQNAPVPSPPSWFKKLDAKVRIVRDHFVACELSGKFDIQTPSENQLATGGVKNADIPKWGDVGSQNPADGIIDVRFVVQIDDAKDIVTVSGYFGADPADRDGLKMIGWLPPAPNPLPPVAGFGQNFLGLGIAFWPLIAEAAGAAANNGAAVELAVLPAGYAVVAGMAALAWFRVERIVWYGGEFDVQVRRDGTQVMVLVDLETAISAEVSIGPLRILTIRRETPLEVRYKAIGFLLGNPPGQPKFQFLPYFDSSKGYTIDVSKPGAIQVHEPFDRILKILGARISRNNPFFAEVDLGFAVDLGVVAIERARVRLNLSPGGPPELTAFAASVDIPGALRGRGTLEMSSDSQGNFVMSGSLDLLIVPVGVRIAAGIKVAQIPPEQGGPATGVMVTLEVDFPVALPLGCSGLGIYGLIGLFAVNFQRNEDGIVDSNKALAWLKATALDRTNPSPTNPRFWKPQVNTWNFGVGAVLGTVGSSIIFNLKGMVLLELPGPRLLLMMKANLLIPPPDLHDGKAEGMVLAVVDLDFDRKTLTAGMLIDFKVEPLIEIKVPVEAFFHFGDPKLWHIYLGQFSKPVQATVLAVFDGSGYLMLSGDGIPSHPAGLGGSPLPAVTGFAIAAGLHLSFTWGVNPLYARLAAGFDAVVGFQPFRMSGLLYVRGTLHLFITDISAWAELTVDSGYDGSGGHISQISGKVCGKVEFLFFSISGCVKFSLGGPKIDLPLPPKLVVALKLVSRSPALVHGTGADQPIDAVLADGVESDPGPPGGSLPVVPIDIVPALMLAMPPVEDAGLRFFNDPIGGTPQTPSGGWVQRGDMWFRYTLKKVELTGPVTSGKTPAVWWNTKAGDQALEAQLALLSWVPDATPAAVASSQFLDELIRHKWGNVCQPGAPAAPVFWTFFNQVLGPSDYGWYLTGTAFPDPPDMVRSSPPDLSLEVTERWRCGNSAVDRIRGIVPAEVEGAVVPCPGQPAPQPSPAPLPLPVHNPIRALRGSAVQAVHRGEALTVAELMRQAALGQPVSRAAMTTAVFVRPGATGLAGVGGDCFAWALASPLFDDGKVIAFGDPDLAAAVTKEFGARGFRPGPLDDAVVFDFGGEFEYARFYLWVPERLLDSGAIVVAASDGNDNLTNVHPITLADRIPPAGLPPAGLPPTWLATSPWQNAVFLLEELALQASRHYAPVMVEIAGSAGANFVQIGCAPASRPIRAHVTLRPFYVGAIEALKRAEAGRSSYDTTEQIRKQGVLSNALGLDSADCALLTAGQPYQVKATWSAESQQRTPGQPDSAVKSFGDLTQTFWFHTDSKPPAKLNSWVLAALPGEGETHCFASAAVKVVFGSNNVNRLYDAYGKKLRARLRPASFVQVPNTINVPHPVPLNSKFVQPVKASILTPWESAVESLAAASLPCVSVSGERTRHSMLTIPIPLDLYTDYLLDIEMVDRNAPDGTVGTVVWRGSFSTGGFRSESDFAHSYEISDLSHRGVHADDVGKLQAIGTAFAGRHPEGAEFDTAIVGAGLDSLPAARYPGFLIFWEAGGGTPQPVAILVDASEPMRRSRPIPIPVNSLNPAAARWYELSPQPFLDLKQQPGGDDIVDQIVMAPGGQRALVTLKPNSRGKHVILALVRIPHPEPYLDGPGATEQFFPILDLNLTVAPWEEED